MSFYGNITNTSRTQFQFDKTFPNRKIMEEFANLDGVYIGRYVLVEYDKDLAADWTTVAFKKTINGVITFYSSATAEENTRLRYGYGNIQQGKYIRVPAALKDTDSTYIYYDLDTDAEDRYQDKIYEILSSKEGETPKVSEVVVKGTYENDYIANYTIDRLAYGGGRGYDSTVWQKVYADGIERYVMIAELNTVVPTFGVSADAPTMSPVAPHFSADSTNMYYKVHWQPNWGLRVKSAAPSITVKPIDDTGKTIGDGSPIVMSSTSKTKLPTDENTYWLRSSYDASTDKQKNYYYMPAINKETLKTSGEWRDFSGVVSDNIKFPAAIYYNKAGFDPATITYSDESIKDQISIEPTGLSGQTYNAHDGSGSKIPQIDTQELSIMLPSIGDSVAKLWDLVYGDEDINGSKKRNTYIKWNAGSVVPNASGLRLVSNSEDGYGYEPKQAETLAGVINSVHDLMGMNIQKKTGKAVDYSSSDIKALGSEYIYYLEGDKRYYRAHKTYNYTGSITSFTKADRYKAISNLTTWPKDGYYYLDYASVNPKPGGSSLPYPNFIRSKEYDENRTYYSTITTGAEITKFSGGSFEPYKFFEYAKNVSLINELGGTVLSNLYRTSLDNEFDSSKSYVKITYKALPLETRFWSSSEKYYIADFKTVSNPTYNMLINQELFIKDASTGRYERASSDNGIVSGTTYYRPENFSQAKSLDTSKQHFVVKQKTEGNTTYVEVPIYSVAKNITASNFADGEYYIKLANGQYSKATSYSSGTTYYTVEYILQIQDGEPTISPSNITEVFLKDINSAPVVDGKTGGVYCQYRPNAYKAHDEYLILTASNCKGFTNNLGVMYIDSDLGIYEPNLYYYHVDDENSPLYDSYIFDSNSKPTEGRVYYAAGTVQSSGLISTAVYEPYKYYYKSGNDFILSTTKERDTSKTYYKKNGLYVKSDTTNTYPEGMEWNLNITSVPTGVILSEATEVWEFQELEGFARHYNTIHGLVLRANSLLEQKDSLVRNYDTVQGLMNKLKDFLVYVGEMYANQIVVSDEAGRLTTAAIKGDNWINATYTRGNGITINHIGTGANGTYTVNGETTNRTLAFGGTFTSPSFTATIDSKGHTTKFESSKKTITMPSISLSHSGPENGNVVSSITMGNQGVFTETKTIVGNLKLTGYTVSSTDNTGITSNDTINGAFDKVNTALTAALNRITELESTNSALNSKIADLESKLNG